MDGTPGFGSAKAGIADRLSQIDEGTRRIARMVEAGRPVMHILISLGRLHRDVISCEGLIVTARLQQLSGEAGDESGLQIAAAELRRLVEERTQYHRSPREHEGLPSEPPGTDWDTVTRRARCYG